jgi:hypothetical protein
MEIKHLAHHEINCQKWDTCIQNAQNSLVYAESWYLDLVSPKWEALILGDYEYVMPLPLKRKFGIPFLVQPPLSQQLGIFSGNSMDEKMMEHFIAKIPYKSYHLHFNEQNPCKKGTKQPNLILKLNTNYDTIFSAYSTNAKRNIKKALQAKVNVVEMINPEQFLKFYFSEMSDEAKPDKALTTNIIELGHKKEKVCFYGAFTPEHRLISALCLLRSKKRFIYWLAASNREGKELSAMSLIVDTIIQNNAETDFIFDFEGSKVEGIARFYQGFGAVEMTYPLIKKNSVIQIMNRIKKGFVCR